MCVWVFFLPICKTSCNIYEKCIKHKRQHFMNNYKENTQLTTAESRSDCANSLGTSAVYPG